ncbi:MAG: type 4 pilus major pilin [Alphaproteobacteria bacterium]
MTNLYKNDQSGRSMVEMLGVLAIIGVLSVGGIAGYSKAMTKFKINKTMDQVSMLVANIRTLYSGQRNYSDLDNATAINFGIIPNEMYSSASKIVNAFNGEVTIAAAAGNVAAGAGTGVYANKAFQITYNGLSQEACVSIATADWGTGAASGLVGMAVSNAAATSETVVPAYYTYNTGTVTTDLPVALSQAAAVCNCNTEPTCSISWRYQ